MSFVVKDPRGPRGVRVLVVDDNPQMRTIITTILQQAGVKAIYQAPDGRTGLTLLSRVFPDVILLDYQMPGMSGLQFVAKVRSQPGSERKVPIIMLTGHTESTRLKQARDRGVTEILAKPISPGRLLQRLHGVLFSPRPFIEAPAYVGPERRRRPAGDLQGAGRRAEEAREALRVRELLG